LGIVLPGLNLYKGLVGGFIGRFKKSPLSDELDYSISKFCAVGRIMIGA